MDFGEDIAVGCVLSIKTTFGDEFEGQILAYDRSTDLLLLQEGGSKPGLSNVRLLKACYIAEFSLVQRGSPAEDPLDKSRCGIDLAAVLAREDMALRQTEMEEERIGVGVSAEAQALFDALFKTLPVRWDKTDIVVMNEVRVSSPYLPENVRGGTAAANERVKKVLDLERKRLQARLPAQF